MLSKQRRKFTNRKHRRADSDSPHRVAKRARSSSALSSVEHRNGPSPDNSACTPSIVEANSGKEEPAENVLQKTPEPNVPPSRNRKVRTALGSCDSGLGSHSGVQALALEDMRRGRSRGRARGRGRGGMRGGYKNEKCTYWQSGVCRASDKCPYQHPNGMDSAGMAYDDIIYGGHQGYQSDYSGGRLPNADVGDGTDGC